LGKNREVNFSYLCIKMIAAQNLMIHVRLHSYVKNGKPTGILYDFQLASRPLVEMYKSMQVGKFT